MKIIITCTFLFILFLSGTAQNALSFKIVTISAHPFAVQNLPLHRNPIDNKGYLTFEPGLLITYDRHLKKKFSANLSTAILNDRFDFLAGYSQIMLKYNILKYYKHSLNIAIGPAVHYEADKRIITGYENEDHLKFIDNTAYKIAWLSGMFEYNFFWNKDFGFTLSLNHTHPHSLALAAGIRFDIPDPNGKGCNCPSFR
jgi:hypothetical protein